MGIPCIRDRVAQTAAMLVVSPIFEADLQAEQYAYREGRSALDAVQHVHRLVHSGHREVVDGDSANYFGEIPHCDLIRSIARPRERRAHAGLDQDVVGNGRGRGRRERRQTPHEPGAPGAERDAARCSDLPLLRNVYMRRFILGWKQSGHARRYGAEIVNYADDFVVCGKAPAEAMRAIVERMMEQLRLPVNATKTRCLRCPEEPMEFLGYRIGRKYSPRTGRAYIGTRPSKASVRSICRKISEPTEARYGLLGPEQVVGRLNRAMLGWANDFRLGQVSPAYRAVDAHATKRLRQWLCRKHKVRSGQSVRYPDTRLWADLGLTRLAMRTASRPWAKA